MYNVRAEDRRKFSRIAVQIVKLAADFKGVPDTQEKRIRYWVRYLKLYDRIVELKAKYPLMPDIPPFLLTAEQEESVRVEILDRNIRRYCPFKGHPEGPFSGLEKMKALLDEHISHKRIAV